VFNVTRGFEDLLLKRRQRKEQKKTMLMSHEGQWLGLTRERCGVVSLYGKHFISSVFIIFFCSPSKSNVLCAFVFNTHLTLPT
jgi:hypothetical protein